MPAKKSFGADDSIRGELYLRLVCASTIEPSWAERVPEFVPGVLTVPATYTGRAVAMHFDINSLGVTREEATRMGLANLRRRPLASSLQIGALAPQPIQSNVPH